MYFSIFEVLDLISNDLVSSSRGVGAFHAVSDDLSCLGIQRMGKMLGLVS